MTIAFKKIAGSDDPESTHKQMDDLMVETLEILGYENAMEVFKESKKWYA